MTNEGRAGVVLVLFVIAFGAGCIIADKGDRPLGFVLIISSVLITTIYLAGEAKASRIEEAYEERLDNWLADWERRLMEATRNDKD